MEDEKVSRQVRRQLERNGEMKTAIDAEHEKRVDEALARRKGKLRPDQSSEPHGKRNIYVCEQCFGHVVTVDLVEGVTPFMMECRATAGCKGAMQSSFYRVFDQRMKPAFEWYKPDAAEMATLKPWSKEHVDKGGLLIRQIAP